MNWQLEPMETRSAERADNPMEPGPTGPHDDAPPDHDRRLGTSTGLQIEQQKHWGEILTGFEARNRYQVIDAGGGALFEATEISKSLLTRTLLGAWRPFRIELWTTNQRPASLVLSIRRPFRWYFHCADIFDSRDRKLGSVQRQFALLSRRYLIRNAGGQTIFSVAGPFYRPWTFRVYRGRQQYATIVKRWSGLLKEMYTDADRFGVQFPADAPLSSKYLLLGSVFLIDFVHFEQNHK